MLSRELETALKALFSSTSPNSQRGDTISTLTYLCTAAVTGQASKVEREELKQMIHDRYNEPSDETTVYEWAQWNTFVAAIGRDIAAI